MRNLSNKGIVNALKIGSVMASLPLNLNYGPCQALGEY